ncbi:MAG: Fe(3+) ABC transporter substrate-binding protein [Gammaproteobacteria bacterium]|jgi:iron(III) transport system substrate-binding protein|nr:MAG: iron deficiency-induced protein A [Gammaproteobacteria bacterium SG8_31]
MHRKPKFFLITLLAATAAGFSVPALSESEVNLYSARQEALIKPLLEKFTEETGIRVNLVTGKADALLKRLESEGRNSPADVLLTVDAGRLHRAKALGVIQAIDSPVLEAAIPASYRDPEGDWWGLSLRARPIMYARDRVNPDELESYEALVQDKWRGRICIRSSDNIYNQSLVASMIASDGAAAAEQWARGLVANFARPPRGGDRDQIKAVASGQCDIAIANTYYLGHMLASTDEAEQSAAEKLAIFWPNQDGRGTHVNVSGAAVTRSARNREEAVRLIEFLSTDSAQTWYAQVNYEYPVKSGVAWSPTLTDWGTFKADQVNLEVLGELNTEAVRIMDRAGWK